LGTSDRTLEEFLELLAVYGIEVVVDIRGFPESKIDPFKQKPLQRAVRGAGREYLYLGRGVEKDIQSP
jgi:uncharacterized protein (DUF488 family)